MAVCDGCRSAFCLVVAALNSIFAIASCFVEHRLRSARQPLVFFLGSFDDTLFFCSSSANKPAVARH